MKTKIFALTVAALLLVGFSTGFADDKVYINGFDAAYPPFSFIDKSGKPDGFDVDCINWIAKEMGFKVKHQPTDWAAIVPSLKAKKIDLIASGMSITPERQAAVNFCNPYWQVIQYLVVRNNSNLTVEEALKPGRKIALPPAPDRDPVKQQLQQQQQQKRPRRKRQPGVG